MKQDVVVLDTNVLLDDPMAFHNYPGKLILIPIVVIEEIDKFKKDLNGLGRNAREVSRQLDALRERGSLSNGVDLENGAHLQIVLRAQTQGLAHPLMASMPASNDNYILAVAVDAHTSNKYESVALVSKDTNMRLKADALGVQAQDFRADMQVQIEELYTGQKEVKTTRENIDTLFSTGTLSLPEEEFYPNQYVLLADEIDPQHRGLGRFDPTNNNIVPVKPPHEIWGIKPRSLEQKIAMDLLLSDSIPLVTLVGKAGTGKTLLALACGLSLTVDQNRFNRLLVSRPVFPMGRDIGFLPGELQDKLKPWMQPIFDNLEFILGGGSETNEPQYRGKNKGGDYEDLMKMGSVVVEPLTYIRGRSIPKQYFIVDESQNLTPHEIKTIISRAGEGTKIILTGDPYQIDNPYLDASSNGLAYVTERMKGSSVSGHITLQKGERSLLAQAAADLL